MSSRWDSAAHSSASGSGPARRELLEQGDVPLRRRDACRVNSRRSERLTWTCVALRSVRRHSRERRVRSAASGGKSRPWKTFQVRARIRTAQVSTIPAFLMATRHFLTGEELTADELGALLDRALELKAGRERGGRPGRARGQDGRAVLRAAVDAHADLVPGRRRGARRASAGAARPTSCSSAGASRSPTRRGCCRGSCTRSSIRSGSDETVTELAEAAAVPVVNGLTPLHHPCQALADLLTLRERFGDARRAAARLRRRRQQRRALARDRRRRGGGGGRRRGARGLSARGRSRGVADRRSARGGRRAPTRSTPTSG